MPREAFPTFGPGHLLYLLGTVAVWAAVIWWGRRAGPAAQRSAALVLVAVTLLQEVGWDTVGLLAGTWRAAENLPLHLCSMALFFSAYALVTRNRMAFEAAYFWGVVATAQALLTPDPTRWRLGGWDVLWHFLSHGVIVLNVLWLVLVMGMRLRRGAWLRTLVLTNLLAIPIGLFDWVTGFNYFYLRAKPAGDSPFLLGDWPYYLLVLEAVALVLFFLAEQVLPGARGDEGREGGDGPLPEAATP